jgi:hypothetical protein
MADVFEVYRALWQSAEQLGATVRYDSELEDGAGSFHPDPWNRGESFPRITIGRPYHEEVDRPTRNRNTGGREALPPPDLLRETITLAHEFGHFLSWKRSPDEWNAYFEAAKTRDEAWSQVPRDGSVGEYNNQLRTAAQSRLTRDQMGRIVAEEERAWAIGRGLLADLGFEDLELYAEHERRGLHFHRYRLGIDDLWEGDLGPSQ